MFSLRRQNNATQKKGEKPAPPTPVCLFFSQEMNKVEPADGSPRGHLLSSLVALLFATRSAVVHSSETRETPTGCETVLKEHSHAKAQKTRRKELARARRYKNRKEGTQTLRPQQPQS